MMSLLMRGNTTGHVTQRSTISPTSLSPFILVQADQLQQNTRVELEMALSVPLGKEMRSTGISSCRQLKKVRRRQAVTRQQSNARLRSKSPLTLIVSGRLPIRAPGLHGRCQQKTRLQSMTQVTCTEWLQP